MDQMQNPMITAHQAMMAGAKTVNIKNPQCKSDVDIPSEPKAIIEMLMQKLETQREQSEAAMHAGFEEAYKIILNEREKYKNLEVELHEEYDKKVRQVKDFLAEKVDQFLKMKYQQFLDGGKYSQAEGIEKFHEQNPGKQVVEEAATFQMSQIYITDIDLTFEMLEKAMNLPSGVKIAGIQEGSQKGLFSVRLASVFCLPGNYSIPSLAEVGNLFDEPEKYEVSDKGSTIQS